MHKTYLIASKVSIILLLLGCTSSTQEPMQGTPVSGQMDAYIKMCLREPGSVLCPAEEFFVTNSSSLNQQWCDICKLDSGYSWCKHFPECVTEPTPYTPEEPTGEPMQGRAVNVRAKAYQDLCNRTPDSVLCKQ